MACTYCTGAPEWEIKKYPNWTIYLKKNQAYLGSVVVALNRHASDIFATTPEELNELQRITLRMTELIKDRFGAKMFGYVAQSSIDTLHANLQIIPRYSDQVEFGHYQFVDVDFGRSYDPAKNKELDPDMYKELIAAIKQKLYR